MLSNFPASLPFIVFLDQWVVKYGWRVDYLPFCGLRTYSFGMQISSLILPQGTAQLLVAGVTIYHPEWVATTWQTCVFVSLL